MFDEVETGGSRRAAQGTRPTFRMYQLDGVEYYFPARVFPAFNLPLVKPRHFYSFLGLAFRQIYFFRDLENTIDAVKGS